jgi:hypothetical protein
MANLRDPLLVVCANLGPHADVALWIAQHHDEKVLTSRNHIGPSCHWMAVKLPIQLCTRRN